MPDAFAAPISGLRLGPKETWRTVLESIPGNLRVSCFVS